MEVMGGVSSGVHRGMVLLIVRVVSPRNPRFAEGYFGRNWSASNSGDIVLLSGRYGVDFRLSRVVGHVKALIGKKASQR